MKKTIVTLTLMFGLSLMGYSQFTKGKILAGGSFNANWSNTIVLGSGSYYLEGKTITMNLYPQVGYFFANNFVAGAGFNVGSTIFKSPSDIFDGQSKSVSNTLSFEPFARYYFLKKFYTQAAFKAGLSFQQKGVFTGGGPGDKFTGWSLAAGYAHMLNEHVALEPQIGYGIDYPGGLKTGNLLFKIGIQVYLGR